MNQEPPHPHTPEWIFWPGSLTARGYAAIVNAAAAGGYSSVAVSPFTIRQLVAAGRRLSNIASETQDRNMTLRQLDGVSSWAPIRYPTTAPPQIRERFDIGSEECLDMAAALGMDSILVVGVFDRDALQLEVLIDAFGRFCDSAATRGLRVELEFVPYWGVPDLSSAWDIVRLANRPNTGILIDTWHLQKGSTDFERNLQLLSDIPAERLTNIQLADATLIPEADTLFGQGRLRRFPGDGELAIDRIVSIVQKKGQLQRIGTEVFGAAIDGLSDIDAGKRCAEATARVVKVAVPFPFLRR